jgi:hypothetical protein
VLQAACGGPNAPLSFEGTPWNSSTVAVIAAAKAHTEMVLLQVRSGACCLCYTAGSLLPAEMSGG